ncbi:MAG: hypothetical protein RR346_07775 [Bacteroidales bacterium]
MKDTVITRQQKIKELIYLSILFLLVCILNLISIVIYKTSFTELFSEIPRVLLITGILYFIILLIRILIHGLKTVYRSLFKK